MVRSQTYLEDYVVLGRNALVFWDTLVVNVRSVLSL